MQYLIDLEQNPELCRTVFSLVKALGIDGFYQINYDTLEEALMCACVVMSVFCKPQDKSAEEMMRK